MAPKRQNKMPIEERAKQFMPFAALRGLPDALAQKEKVLVPKIELSPEMEEELDRQMHLLSKGKSHAYLARPNTKVGIFIFACFSYLCRQAV